MAKDTKRMKELYTKIDQTKSYESEKAFEIVVQNAKSHESVDVVYILGTNPKKSDEVVKGIVPNMPSGLGKKVSVAVFCKTDEKEVLAAGADYAGFDGLIADIKSQKIDADIYVTTKDLMPELAKLGMGRVLKGKMPNPKFGTVVEKEQLIESIKSKKAGQLTFRSNASIIHAAIGKAFFSAKELQANFKELHAAIVGAKPQKVKQNVYIKRIFVSSTMGLSLKIDNNIG